MKQQLNVGKGFYIKMAWLGIQKNKRLYLPYILTCIGMVMMYYIVSFLSTSTVLRNIPGGQVMQFMLSFGCFIIGLFSLLFLFYTNSFLIRRRKKEFGLYNILGMGKRNLGHILFWESIIIAIISLIGGLAAGISFSKLAELGMVNILKSAVSFSIKLDLGAVLQTMKIFAVIFFLLLFYSLYQIHLSNPIELLHSENTGEKPPRANWVLAFLGFVILGIAYYLACSIERPIEAVLWFFVAVALVIIATYLLFIAGSVVICRMLQKNKDYYYQTNHFVSIASMVYRMKRNGAGLASICILCTMVLVMISGTACLYIGTENALEIRYPRDINLDVSINNIEQMGSGKMEVMRQLASETVNNYGEMMENVLDYRVAVLSAYVENGAIKIEDSGLYAFQMSAVVDIWEIFFVPLEDYNRLTGRKETLESNEVFIYTTKLDYDEDSITLPDRSVMKVKKSAFEFVESGRGAMEILPSMYIVMSDFYEKLEPIKDLTDKRKEKVLKPHWIYGFDVKTSNEKQIQIQAQFQEKLQQLSQLGQRQNAFFSTFFCEGIAENRNEFYGLYGGLFFLGILLGVVFLFAAVLIMYYKQVSEGYEDQSRFEIMKKLGMTQRDIKRSINSQILTVFFLPLLTAGVHLLFAFPLLHKLLVLFNLTDKNLLMLITFSCFFIFALFYVFVYRITSRAYYMIVSHGKDEE